MKMNDTIKTEAYDFSGVPSDVYKIYAHDFAGLPNDIYGNPRYYLPVYLLGEMRARKAGGVKYRGKRYGAGWVFQTYCMESLIERLNA
jgi:hypothetical protein